MTSPWILRPFNLLWFRFALLVHRIVTPVVMGLMFFGVVTPVAALMRLCGKDPLRLKRNGNASRWIRRQPPGPAPETTTNQV